VTTSPNSRCSSPSWDSILGESTESSGRTPLSPSASFSATAPWSESAALTKETLLTLRRVRATNAVKSLVTDARDLAGIDPLTSGSVLLCGDGPLLEGLVHSYEGNESILVSVETSQEESALCANTHDVALVLSFQTLNHVEGIHLHYWASYRNHSHRGEVLASTLASVFAHQPQVAPGRSDGHGLTDPARNEDDHRPR
jgi:hypothetical protein